MLTTEECGVLKAVAKLKEQNTQLVTALHNLASSIEANRDTEYRIPLLTARTLLARINNEKE